MSEQSIPIESIGVIHTPFTDLKNMPIQPAGAEEVEGKAVVFEEYVEGLKDLEGFSHIYLITYFHKAPKTEMTVTPFLDTVPRGVFATRSPLRPSHIGLSLVKLSAIEGSTVRFLGADILDGTPLLDIKPYVGVFERVDDVRTGWLQATEQTVQTKRSDERFT